MAQRQSVRGKDPDVREWLRKLPKAELHLHLEGTVAPATLVALSQRHDEAPLTLAQAQGAYVYQNFLGFLDSFKTVTQRMRAPEDYELVAYEMIRALAAQGVAHAEVYISFGIIYYWKHEAVEPYVEAIERARLRGEQEFGVSVLWIIDAVRHFGAEQAARVFTKAAELRAQYPSIVGIGIGGDEARGPADHFRELYATAAAAGLRLTAHAGESVGPESIWAALNIGAERLGHALAAQHDPELMDVLANRQIVLELCPTSNVRTGCCRSMEEHPLRQYFDSGLMVTLNSDDPPMFGSDLLGEYLLAHEHFGFTLEQMRELAANSIEASFLPAERKLDLLRQVELYAW
jgi:adenosine deaminase/aminodeoxyfutalosine deaminase